jgi:hypothetical protein
MAMSQQVAGVSPTATTGPAMGSTAVCTVAEGQYHFGVAALCNSLYRHGYRGRVWVGCRGELPGWAADAVDVGSWRELAVAQGFDVCFVPIEGPWHLSNYKPAFLRRVLEELAPKAEALFYFDSDIVIRCQWDFFEDWVERGVALIQDMWDPGMLPTHIFKKRWAAHARKLGYQARDVAGYFNGGFVGVARADLGFVAIWEEILKSAADAGGDMRRLKLDDPNHIFYKMDQDALNVAVLATAAEIVTGGQEMMEIYPWGEVMAHAMHFNKPWKRRYLWDALNGFPPGRPHLAHWENVDGPISSYSNTTLLMKRLDIWAARVVGKLHHRSLHY